MPTVSNPSFDACRVNACATLQLLAHGQQWREQVLQLQQRRLERDRAALEGTLETLRESRDWSDFATASQSVLRDYLSASAAIWQEGVAAAMHGAGAWADTARDITQDWQDSLSGLQPGTSTPSALPMSEWMAAFERAVGGAYMPGVPGASSAAANGATEGATEGAARSAASRAAAGRGGKTEAAQGEQHGR